MTPTRVITDKQRLRALMVRRRAGLGEDVHKAAAAAAASVLQSALDGRTVRCIAGFWPLADEIDPRPAVARFVRRGAAQALPRMQGFGRPLAFHRYSDGAPLVEGRFKVMEPPADAPVADPDLILVPLLAFDRSGGRLGHGAGFYDRTLQACRRERPLMAIGFALACQEADAVPIEPHDQPLDGVVTEREFIPTHVWSSSPA